MKTNRLSKRIKLLSALTGISACGLTAFAGGDLHFRPIGGESSAAVLIVGTEPSTIRISIENRDETVVYYSDLQARTHEYKKRFDFSGLENGSYTLIAYIDEEKVVKDFNIVDSRVEVATSESPAVPEYSPVFRVSGNYLVCLYENKTDHEVLVTFSNNNNTFFEESFDTGINVIRKYEISELPRGEYEVALMNGSNIFTYSLSR
jgi:hypothetical protein